MNLKTEWLLVLAFLTRSVLTRVVPASSKTLEKIRTHALNPSWPLTAESKRHLNKRDGDSSTALTIKTVSDDKSFKAFETNEAFAKDEPSRFCGETLYYVVEYYCVYVKGTGVFVPDGNLDEVISRDDQNPANKKRQLSNPSEDGKSIKTLIVIFVQFFSNMYFF
jgi:hypothetical protein